MLAIYKCIKIFIFHIVSDLLKKRYYWLVTFFFFLNFVVIINYAL